MVDYKRHEKALVIIGSIASVIALYFVFRQYLSGTSTASSSSDTTDTSASTGTGTSTLILGSGSGSTSTATAIGTISEDTTDDDAFTSMLNAVTDAFTTTNKTTLGIETDSSNATVGTSPQKITQISNTLQTSDSTLLDNQSAGLHTSVGSNKPIASIPMTEISA